MQLRRHLIPFLAIKKASQTNDQEKSIAMLITFNVVIVRLKERKQRLSCSKVVVVLHIRPNL